jgi:hypothetical protein
MVHAKDGLALLCRVCLLVFLEDRRPRVVGLEALTPHPDKLLLLSVPKQSAKEELIRSTR